MINVFRHLCNLSSTVDANLLTNIDDGEYMRKLPIRKTTKSILLHPIDPLEQFGTFV